MKWYVDVSGWNGSLGCYTIVNERKEFPLEYTAKEFTHNEMEYQALIKALERR